jgi:hypothetical protein
VRRKLLGSVRRSRKRIVSRGGAVLRIEMALLENPRIETGRCRAHDILADGDTQHLPQSFDQRCASIPVLTREDLYVLAPQSETQGRPG